MKCIFSLFKPPSAAFMGEDKALGYWSLVRVNCNAVIEELGALHYLIHVFFLGTDLNTTVSEMVSPSQSLIMKYFPFCSFTSRS